VKERGLRRVVNGRSGRESENPAGTPDGAGDPEEGLPDELGSAPIEVMKVTMNNTPKIQATLWSSSIKPSSCAVVDGGRA
jgi:hypothetical protein